MSRYCLGCSRKKSKHFFPQSGERSRRCSSCVLSFKCIWEIDNSLDISYGKFLFFLSISTTEDAQVKFYHTGPYFILLCSYLAHLLDTTTTIFCPLIPNPLLPQRKDSWSRFRGHRRPSLPKRIAATFASSGRQHKLLDKFLGIFLSWTSQTGSNGQ